MSWFIDLVAQVLGVLRPENGGTGNQNGWSKALVEQFMNRSGATIARGSVVRLNSEFQGDRLVLTTVADDPRVLGVVVGMFGPDGFTFIDADVPHTGVAAVMLSGSAGILIDGAVAAGAYLTASATPGRAHGRATFSVGAFARAQGGSPGGSVSATLIARPMLAASAGDVHASFFGDVTAPGASGLLSDAKHVHGRERDASAIGPDAVATAVAGGSDPGLAIDGNSGTQWSGTSGNPGAGMWLAIDLGRPREVLGWHLLQRVGALGNNRVTTFDVQSSDDGATWVTRATYTNPAAEYDSGKFPAAIVAQHWRFLAVVGGGGDPFSIFTADLRTVPYAPLDTDGLVPLDYLPSGIGGGAPLSDADPLPDASVASPGVGTSSSRDDHVHVGEAGPAGADGVAGAAGAVGAAGAAGAAGADGLGVPAAGATGQVLTKVSGADNDTAWVDAPSGGGGGGGTGAYVHAGVQTIVERAGGIGPVIWADPANTDPDGFWNPVTPTRLTVPSGKGGLYTVVTLIGFDNGGSLRVQFAVNGAIPIIGFQEAGGYVFGMNGVLMLAAGDYVEVLAPAGQQVLLTYIPSPYFVLIKPF